MAKTNKIAEDIQTLKKHIIYQEPEHFGKKRIFFAFFGALLVGLTFTLKGLLFQVSQALTRTEIALIILGTLIILTAEIYVIGYARVQRKKKRRFLQFWIKRLITYYIIALAVATALVYIYGLPKFATATAGILKMVIAVSLPCAIGAAAADLLEKF